MNDLILANQPETIVQAVDPTQARNVLHLTLTPELGGDRTFNFADLDLDRGIESTQEQVFNALDRALSDDGIRLPRGSYVVQPNATSNSLSVFPKSGFGNI